MIFYILSRSKICTVAGWGSLLDDPGDGAGFGGAIEVETEVEETDGFAGLVVVVAEAIQQEGYYCLNRWKGTFATMRITVKR